MLKLHDFNKLHSFFSLWCSMFICQQMLKKITAGMADSNGSLPLGL